MTPPHTFGLRSALESYLVVLVELTAEGHSQIARSTRDRISSKESFPIFVTAVPPLTKLYVLKARLHTETRKSA